MNRRFAQQVLTTRAPGRAGRVNGRRSASMCIPEPGEARPFRKDPP